MADTVNPTPGSIPDLFNDESTPKLPVKTHLSGLPICVDDFLTLNPEFLSTVDSAHELSEDFTNEIASVSVAAKELQEASLAYGRAFTKFTNGVTDLSKIGLMDEDQRAPLKALSEILININHYNIYLEQLDMLLVEPVATIETGNGYFSTQRKKIINLSKEYLSNLEKHAKSKPTDSASTVYRRLETAVQSRNTLQREYIAYASQLATVRKSSITSFSKSLLGYINALFAHGYNVHSMFLSSDQMTSKMFHKISSMYKFFHGSFAEHNANVCDLARDIVDQAKAYDLQKAQAAPDNTVKTTLTLDAVPSNASKTADTRKPPSIEQETSPLPKLLSKQAGVTADLVKNLGTEEDVDSDLDVVAITPNHPGASPNPELEPTPYEGADTAMPQIQSESEVRNTLSVASDSYRSNNSIGSAEQAKNFFETFFNIPSKSEPASAENINDINIESNLPTIVTAKDNEEGGETSTASVESGEKSKEASSFSKWFDSLRAPKSAPGPAIESPYSHDTMRGYLNVKTISSLNRTTWPRCYMFIQPEEGKLYKVENGVDVEKADLILCEARTSSSKVAERMYTFDLIAPYLTFELQAFSAEERQLWIDAVTACKTSALESPTHTATSFKFGQTRSPNPNRRNSTSERPVPVKRLKEALRAVPGNNTCVDCEVNDPQWASLNLGVLFCLDCAGAHRNLGVMHSQVRSITLDSWTEDNLVRVQRIGNEHSNAQYEAKLDYMEKISMTKSFLKDSNDRFAFIRNKYVNKLWFDNVDHDSDANLDHYSPGDLNSEELSHAISACPSDDVRLYTGHDDITPLPSTVCLISEPGSLTTSNAALYASTTIDHDDIPIDSYAKSPPSSGSPDPLATLHSTPSLEGSSIMLTDDSDADFSPSEFVGNDD